MNEKLNIQDLIDMLANKHSMNRKDAEGFVKEFFQLIEEALETDRYVKVKGLGTFKLINVDRRESVDVNTGERIQIEGHTKVAFTPEPALRDSVNRPFSHFETVILHDGVVLEDTLMENEHVEDMEEEKFPDTGKGGNASSEEGQQATFIAEPVVIPELAVNEIETLVPSLESIKEGVKEIVNPSKDLSDKTIYSTGDSMPESYTSQKQSKEPFVMKFFIAIVIFIMLLAVVGVAYLYFPDSVQNDTLPVQSDSVQTKKDTISIQSNIPPVKEVSKESSFSVEQLIPRKDAPMPTDNGRWFEPDSTNYKIVGTEFTYKLAPGEMLTKVALRFYGSKRLWPYLVQHNRDVIKNPNNVPSGIELKIPRLEKKQ